MYKKTFILASLTVAILSACSEEKSIKDESPQTLVESDDNKEEISVEQVETSTPVENSEEPKDKLEAVEEIEEIEEIEEVEEVEEVAKISAKQQGVIESIKTEVDYYTIYSSGDKNDEGIFEIPIDVEGEKVQYQELDEGVIELPTITENEETFKNRANKVSLVSLAEQEIVTFVEEPVTKGNLLVFNLEKLKANYVAISYSLIYNDKEYGFIISDKKDNIGLVLIENSEGMLEDIQKNGIINVIK